MKTPSGHEKTSQELVSSVFVYLIAIGAFILVIRFIVGLYIATATKSSLKKETVNSLFLVALAAFIIFLIIIHCVEIRVCKL